MTAGVIVLGSSGHAKVCIELLRSAGASVAYCIGAAESSTECLGVPVLNGDEHLKRLQSEGYEEVFVAIGANALRQRLALFATGLGFRLVNAISPRAVISPTATIGAGVAIMAGAVVNAECVVGDLAIINTLASVDHDGRIGDAAHIAPHCGLAGNVAVGERSFLGVGCKVIPDITIGEDVLAGAGSVIVKNVESGSRIAGVPAKAIHKRA
ncbi:UDP-4-amino-4, 6-dideoxy-N-acetyl-alpha-D-glucosamine N-acetyltransferase [Variovorax sp. PBL-H6]|uniref:acetyltransferase n=1 Tax=Variovorax sp. PBL-H6 TaxID=434009 RepID=UPI001317C309|nr:acetyltransferase [Variovorax sp. PBL-H6]VTU17450.1 UDP-4-amino-4, 6-dideoxy-N-acetyl-alpha-D-glucosamine N-acetyltransferase [Variovorax sp. PBL-H6]